MVSTEIKKEIEEHLTLSNKLHIAAKDVLENGNLSITEDVATKHELDYFLLVRKVNIMICKEDFYDRKRRIEAAIKEIIEGKFTCNDASNNYKISIHILYAEVRKAIAQENYEYDRKINTHSSFTYLQEESLLKILKDWARGKTSQGHCSCTFCALEQLLTLAYEFAKQNNVKCPVWDHTSRQASIGWLINFEMRHTDEINLSFLSFVDIFKQIIG